MTPAEIDYLSLDNAAKVTPDGAGLAAVADGDVEAWAAAWLKVRADVVQGREAGRAGPAATAGRAGRPRIQGRQGPAGTRPPDGPAPRALGDGREDCPPGSPVVRPRRLNHPRCHSERDPEGPAVADRSDAGRGVQPHARSREGPTRRRGRSPASRLRTPPGRRRRAAAPGPPRAGRAAVGLVATASPLGLDPWRCIPGQSIHD